MTQRPSGRAFRGILRALGIGGRVVLRAAAGGRDGLVPLSTVVRIRRLIPGPQGFEVPDRPRPMRDGDPAVTAALAEMNVGAWAVGAEALGLIARTIRSRRPRTVLEFGSGLSTLAMSALLRDAAIAGGRVLSIEQDPTWVQATGALIAERGLGEWAEVVHAPLEHDAELGVSRYVLDPATLHKLVAAPPDLVFVDGPAAQSGSRTHTLVAVLPFLGKAHVLMDDALRDSELETARLWAALPRVQVQGIWPHDKGVLVCDVDGMPEAGPTR